MRTFVIIADDFTGANDTGVQIRKQGIAIDVLFDIDHADSADASVVIDTESRVVPADEAYDRVYRAVMAVMAGGGCRYLYKKVDSTLRGNIREEIRAVLHAYEPELVVFAPAYPAQGRTTEHGRLCVCGRPLLETEIAADPRNPVTEDRIAELLSSCTDMPVHHYGIADMESGAMRFDGGAYTFDTLQQEHLQQIAAAVLRTGKKTLWIGSAGLADGLLSVTSQTLPVLSVIGSVSSRTMEQIEYCRQRGVGIIRMDMRRMYETRKHLEDSVEAAAAMLRSGRDVIFTAAAVRTDYEEFLVYGKEHGKTNDELADFTKQTLSEAVPIILSKTAVCGVFLTGGDTAIAAIRSLKACGSHIDCQIIPGFVQGRLIGGSCDNLPIVTKAGAFGTASDIYDSIQRLKEMAH